MRCHSLAEWTHHASYAPEASTPTAKRDPVVLFSADQVPTMRSSGISMDHHKSHQLQLHNNDTKLKFSSSASSSGSVTQDEELEELHADFEDTNNNPTQQQQQRKTSRTHTLVASSMRSLHMVKTKLKAKLHAALGSRGASGSTGRRPGRAFSCYGSATTAPSRVRCTHTRQKRSDSVGARVFRSRSIDRSAHPLSPPSTSMIFIDC